ncbi:DUF1254 domain-containing protein [Xanthobacter sp. DSM 24535]|uniref:DUF1254 domain-containing protein n=1 Tax=Roseixanthobacter psychrophilus TaxID=3119917 RepID=UPI00372CC885
MNSSLFAACAATLAGVLALAPGALAQAPVSTEEAREIARDAYIYAYPLVLMEVSGKVSTNVAEPPGNTAAPVNQFGNAQAFPDPSFTVVVRPNADTLYSSLVYDVSKEPLIVTVPDSGGRYYLLPMLDKWSDVFAVPGSRTTGNGAQTFAIVGPGWRGELPAGVTRYDSPTAGGWIGGRVQTNGKADYAAVHAFQNGLKAVPLSAYGKPYTPPKGPVDTKLDMSAPPDQIDKMDGAAFFTLFAELMKQNPPHANDYPILDRMKRIGIEPGKSYSPSVQAKEVQEAIKAAPADALPRIKAAWAKAGVLANGWRTNLTAIGTYGADYLHRAGVAFGGLGANVPDDAVYPTAFADSEGRPFDSAKRYVMHFAKEQLPPVRAFWSLTMYDERQLFTENPLDRYAIGDRDKLVFSPDGSLDLYIQRESPGKDKEANWLPTPKSGTFTMNMRLYWPKAEVIEGSWSPPPVKRAD